MPRTIRLKEIDDSLVFIASQESFTWFDNHTICKLIERQGRVGLFTGIREGKKSTQKCGWDEFEIFDQKGNKVEIDPIDFI